MILPSKEIKHIEKSLCDDEFTKEYLEEHYESYLKKLNGYWRKDLKGVGVLDGFIDPEQEEKAKQFSMMLSILNLMIVGTTSQLGESIEKP